jgi:hypothetical protein
MSQASALEPNHRIALAIGAYVLQCQQLERLFKFIVPVTTPDDPSLSGILQRQTALSKKTLGTVAGDFVKVLTGDTEEISLHLRQIVNERNEVVHAFHDRYGELLAAGKHEEILAQLKTKHQRAMAFSRVLRAIAFGILEAFRDGPYRGTDEYADIENLCRSVRAQLSDGTS